jgi:cytochrome P450
MRDGILACVFVVAIATAMSDGDARLVAATTILLLSTTTVVVWWWSRNQSSRRKSFSSPAPPCVRGLPLLGSTIEFGKDCRGFLRKYFAKLQTPIFTARIANQQVHFVDSSYADFSVERLFRHPHLSFTPVADDAVIHGFGARAEAMKKSNGPDGDGKEMNALFHKHVLKTDGLDSLVASVQVKLQSELEEMGNEETELYKLVHRLLFHATVGSVLSPSLATEENRRSFLEFDAKMPLLMAKLPSFLFPKAKQGRDTLTAACLSYSNPSNLIQDRHETMARLGVTDRTDVAILDTTVVWAATANTIPSGFWCLYHILVDRNGAYSTLVEEVMQVMKDRPDHSPLSLQELDGLVGLDSAIQEALRLYSESMIARNVMEDIELDLKVGERNSKYFLQKGSRVAVMMSLLHSDNAVFENASEFQWNRFCPVNGTPKVFSKDGKTLAQPIRPFGGGSSMCPGRKFAVYEIKTFLAWLLYIFDLELVDLSAPKLGIEPGRVGLGINVPARDVQIRISKRSC